MQSQKTICNTVYVVIFRAGLIFASQTAQKFALQYMSIYSNENREIKLSRISQLSLKSRKYLYTKYMAYTVGTCEILTNQTAF